MRPSSDSISLKGRKMIKKMLLGATILLLNRDAPKPLNCLESGRQ